jgi:hypothetical protein
MKSTRLNAWGRKIRIACVIGLIICVPISGLNGQQAAKKSDVSLSDLRQIGMKITGAVLNKDLVTLLSYEPLWRPEHEVSLRDRNSDLYCFLIENHPGCGSFGIPSIFETISGARQHGVAVIDFGRDQDGNRNAVLVFYDSSTISDRSIRSRAFYCDPIHFKKIAFWTFKLVSGKWEASTYLFNYQSDSPC